MILGRKELIELTSQCRFSLLPYDRNKDYVTTKALENGMSNSLVLADKRYGYEECVETYTSLRETFNNPSSSQARYNSDIPAKNPRIPSHRGH